MDGVRVGIDGKGNKYLRLMPPRLPKRLIMASVPVYIG